MFLLRYAVLFLLEFALSAPYSKRGEHNLVIQCKKNDLHRIARRIGYDFVGQVGRLDNYFELKPGKSATPTHRVAGHLKRNPRVKWHEYQVPLAREKRTDQDMKWNLAQAIAKGKSLAASIKSDHKKAVPPKPERWKAVEQGVERFRGSWPDPLYREQWYLDRMNIPEAWKLGYSGELIAWIRMAA